MVREHVRVPFGVVGGGVGCVRREVHEERRPTRCVPYKSLCLVGKEVGIVYLRLVVGLDGAVLVDPVGVAVVGPQIAVPAVPASWHVGSIVVAVEVLTGEDGIVTRLIEPGGYGGPLVPQRAEPLVQKPSRKARQGMSPTAEQAEMLRSWRPLGSQRVNKLPKGSCLRQWLSAGDA